MSLSIAVLTLTRDRLPYTQHCFQKLREFAGCDYQHFVLDNGSTDGTQEWLAHQPVEVVTVGENIGISRGLNLLLDETLNPLDFDVIVKIDNDCELTQPDTLRHVAQLAYQGDAILSPRILGLNHPPSFTRELRIGDETILDIPQIGGIFLAAPAWVYDTFRYPEDAPAWGMDDVTVCSWFREQGGTCGYVKRFEAWHHLGTDGQAADIPDYFERRVLEGGPAR